VILTRATGLWPLRSRHLVKLAYVGRPSRAIFPLTPVFHEISNNAWVAMEARPRLIQDVRTYDGPYYTCDGDVQSELCVPILADDGEVLGIIDAESFAPGHFTAQRAADILAACADLGRWRLGLPAL
jgi:L-methionine (R)-S-oxide reductase